MTSLHFSPHINTSPISFDNVLQAAEKYIDSLSDSKQKSLKNELGNGLADLTSKEQLDMYLSSYGDIHRQKLLLAYEKIPLKVWTENALSIVDYGCGQCIAEMVLSDFLKKKYIDNENIKHFTLIEPSRHSLSQGIKYLNLFFEDCNITAYNITAGELTEDNIQTESATTIHIFSNVLDINEFERENIAGIINQDMSHNHILVCVSPFYQENDRGSLMDDFGKRLRGMECVYKLEKHSDEWDKPFSCQIRVYVSGYY